ncbi:EspG family protein [Streptoalloteichus tenebrarius]|uniref:EspG family protein n=1 Tax=Streptoalloteichus tenebrarius (strain ATCC 17920 / DSM 40477 / JCM 4838 / CBS 697.72 / NBRC 16177 / NCIMB 11028 / NRRL B-12390 / A12253. 1 / ISP 5477) TaxID=1933 RepID=A0ABT1I2U8_STRSD|nr:ESX secretion-associated protein EspG [Streptoalloteichus tenebrarius]MCP2262099.1 EspG family protein [Streptoalloteichus tenebrarius]BFF02253.1 ESX secretion-associated protein EspG [Streptoalloteichus tenebrarius]
MTGRPTTPRPGPAVVISASAFQVAWAELRLGPPPVVLHVPARGVLARERALVVADAWEELERLGLASRRRLDPVLEDALVMLARPRHAVDARIGTGGRGEARVLAAASGEVGVLAVLHEASLRLRHVSGAELGWQAVALLADRPPGPGEAVSAPRDAIDFAVVRAGPSAAAFAEGLIRRGVLAADARRLARMVGGVRRRGQFGVAVVDRHGRRRRAPRVVAFHDTAHGRYLVEERAGADGRRWTTVAPADNACLARRVRDLLDRARHLSEGRPVEGAMMPRPWRARVWPRNRT